jgi:hypothetical protein
MKASIVPEELQQHWIHSHEEDTPQEMVFRPATYPFPRSRGRSGFELRPDGTYVEAGIAPTDGPKRTQGKWQLHEDGGLALYQNAQTEPSRLMHVVSVEDGRLVIRKG